MYIYAQSSIVVIRLLSISNYFSLCHLVYTGSSALNYCVSFLSIIMFIQIIYILKFLPNSLYFFILGALSEKDVIEYFALNEISNRLCTVQQTSALTGEGIERALDNMISFRKHLERMKA